MKNSVFALSAALAAALVLSTVAAAQENPEGGESAPAAPQGPQPSMFLVGVAKTSTVDHNPVRIFSGRILSPNSR